MAGSFGAVEDKLREASFFLEKLGEAEPYTLEVNHYFSAFVSAARSVTFAIQVSMKGVDQFAPWYESARERLKSDPIAQLFVDLRNNVIHRGDTPINRVEIADFEECISLQMNGDLNYHFLRIPAEIMDDNNGYVDIAVLSEKYFKPLAQLVFDCYEKFKFTVAPRWYFTEENFRRRGLDIADAFEEKGLPRTMADRMPQGGDPWKWLRLDQPYCSINDIFDRYLNVVICEPE